LIHFYKREYHNNNPDTSQMPRIDPAQLLKTLGVLLAPHGGIKSTEEVSRLVQLMQKFSKKLVSKVIYVKILKSSSPDLLEAFLNEKGWELLNAWFTDAIKTQNWPLCTELLALLSLCPISASRLKENLDHNQAPRLVRQLSSDARVDSGVRQQAGLLLTRWMSIVSPAPEAPMRSLRITRSVIVPTPRVQVVTPAPGNNRVLVAVHTSTEEIINMGNMTVSNSGMTTSHNITSTTMSTTGIHPVTVDPFDAILSPGVPQYSQPQSAGHVIGVIRNECLDDAITKPVVSPIRLQIRSQAVESNAGGVDILAELSNELSETLKKEVKDEIKKDVDEKNKKGKQRSKDRVKDKERSKDSNKSKDRDREKNCHRDRDRKDRDKKHRDGDEKSRREKERQREKEKKEKKPRESKSFREAEVRVGLDSAQKQRIKELAEKMRQEVKTLPKIPKVPKSAEPQKEKTATLSKATGGIKKPSFTDLMNAMGTTSTKTVKAAPIKNKNRLLLESLESSEISKPSAKTQQEPKKIDRTEYLLNFKTEDKSALVKSTRQETKISNEKVEIKSIETGAEDKKAFKRPLEEEPKLMIKSQSQLSEGSGFSDFLSTIIPDVPKKKKIKFSDLKAQKEASLKAAESSSVASVDTDVKEETESSDSKPVFSFYGGGNAEGDEHERISQRERISSLKEESIKDESEEMEVREEDSGPREVRGILVISKGAKRSRSIQWRAETMLVEVEYFEVEEGERVNVNKLKFEEQRKKELELEKMRMKSKPELETDDRQWPLISSLGLSCEMPDIEYGGNSKEKKEQQLRETSTLQALFFNKNGPSDPLEPDSGLGARLECRPIPLEDTSGEEEAVNDYSELGWPEPVFDKFMANNPPPPVFVPPPSLLGPPPGAAPPPAVPSASHILQNLIGGGGQIPEGNQQAVDSALFAAQKAAAATLLEQGLLPPVFMDQNVPPETEEIKREEEYMEYEEFTQDTKPPLSHHQSHTGGWRGGPPHRGQVQRGFGRGGGGPNHRMNNHHGHNNEFGRGGGFGGQRGGMHHPLPQRGGHFPQRGFPNRPPNVPRGRPCKFWMETGYCRQENRCKFLHPAGPGGPGVAR